MSFPTNPFWFVIGYVKCISHRAVAKTWQGDAVACFLLEKEYLIVQSVVQILVIYSRPSRVVKDANRTRLFLPKQAEKVIVH